jgi:hypothetical protein
MRKRIIAPSEQSKKSEISAEWLDLEQLATVELTSEDTAHPIESALVMDGGSGWRAENSGKQTIRLHFDKPLRITHIHLLFQEDEHARTQEFVLRWSPANSESAREIVRQQFNFSPPDVSHEREDYNVELDGLVMLELSLIPDISDGASRASLAQLRLT